jgi:serine/threonine protein kinase
MSTPSDRTRARDAGAGPGQVTGKSERMSGSSPSDRPSARPGGPESLVGVVLGGRYHVERLIGEGGMGAVYQAEHTHMRKRLALKVLHPEMGRLPEVVARFEREAMAAAHIEHPNVAGATDFGKLDDGSFFLVLEYVEGTILRDAISETPLELSRALHIVRQIASALARAHALGIVHRDLKPENIMLVERDGDADFVKVLDFGIAKVPIGGLVGERQQPGQVLTQLGMVYGTPEYMAPEQALGQPVDARADLYALGAMTFEMITGKRPYDHESKVTLLGMHVTAPIPRMADRAPGANIPPEIDAIVTRLLAKDAAARFGDAKELMEALDAWVPASAIGVSTPTSAAASRLGSPRAVAVQSWNEGGPPTDAASASSIALRPTHLAERTPAPRGSRAVWTTLASLRRAVQSAPSWATSRRGAIVAAAVAAPLLAIVVITASGQGRSSAGSASSSDNAPAARPPDTRVDAIVAAAQATIDRGDFATAIDALTAVERKDPERADVHMLLERAYTGVRNTREALHQTNLWLAADPKAVADLKLQEDVRNAALVKDTQDEAFTVLETKMSTRGIDILYDIAFGTSGRLYPQAAARAKRSLDIEEVRSRASPALAVLLDFRDAKSCDDKHGLLERARDQGDARLLSMLQAYESTRGCGFLGRSDCYPCMHRDRWLSDARSAIEERATRGTQ